MEEDRCDNEMEVFNARVHEDEMIISIEEYQEMKSINDCFESQKREMKARIYQLEEKEKKYLEEKLKIVTEMESIYKESRQLKKGIINFIKALGG